MLIYYAPIKEKIIRGNDKPFITNVIRKEIWKRSRLKNKANKTKLQIDKNNYKIQRNYVTLLVKQSKRDYFQNINIKDEPKRFWDSCKPYLSKTCINNDESIILNINGNLISENEEIANTFNEYYANITNSLNLYTWKTSDSPNLIGNSRQKLNMFAEYTTHPSIIKILNNFRGNYFDFQQVEPLKIYEIMTYTKKGSGPIPIKTLKLLSSNFCTYICDAINNCINDAIFPGELKEANITPIFKKRDKEKCENYRPISILPTFSKIFEKVLFEQISKFFEKIFSKFLCGFRKGFSTQTALLNLIQIWQKLLDNKNIIGTLLIDLSKAYDCISHDLLLAKLEAYGFSKRSLLLLKSYLKGRKQRVKMFNSFSRWIEIKLGIPQGSILGPLLFNIFLNDIFSFLEETLTCNFADDNTIYAYDTCLETVKNKLLHDIEILNRWFKINSLIANPAKFPSKVGILEFLLKPACN